MEQALFDILDALKAKERLDERELTKIINRHNKRILEAQRTVNCAKPNVADESTQNHASASSEPTKARPLSKHQSWPSILTCRKTSPSVGAAGV